MESLPTIDHVSELMAAPVLADQFFDSVAGGQTPEEVCERLGFPLAVFNSWVKAAPDRVSRLAAAQASREEWLRQRIQREWADVSFCDIRDIFKSDGESLKPVNEWPRGIAKAIGSFQVEELFRAQDDGGRRAVAGAIKKFKLLDKLKSSELLARNLGMLDTKVQVSGSVTLEHALADSWNPRKEGDHPAGAPTARVIDAEIDFKKSASSDSATEIEAGVFQKDPPAEKTEGPDSPDVL